MCAKKLSRSSSWAVAGRGIMAMAAAMLSLSSSAKAGFITIDPAGMSAIFSQPSFDGTPVDIRFNPPRLIIDPELLVINTQTQLTALVDLAPDPAPVVDAFFVDQLNAGGFDPGADDQWIVRRLRTAAGPCLCRGLRLRRTLPRPVDGSRAGP